MEEPMIHTEDNYGMDGKVNLPNFTEDVDWKGLEDLYSINESLYGYRNNYRLSPDDWANYLKDVDRIFALLISIPKKSTANTTVVEQISGLSDSSTLVEISSADSEDEFSGVVAEEKEPKMETNFGILNLSTVILNHKKKLETNNDIPERKKPNQAHWIKSKTEKWRDHVNLDTYEMDFSGNGFMELESKSSSNFQTINLPTETPQHLSHAKEDIFKDQIYLPTDSMTRQKNNASAAERAYDSEDQESTKVRSSKNFPEERNTNFDVEGSA
ncbi:uncharacterized protein ACNLHF_023722 [Anomaloglossus baeobatrachus]